MIALLVVGGAACGRACNEREPTPPVAVEPATPKRSVPSSAWYGSTDSVSTAGFQGVQLPPREEAAARGAGLALRGPGRG